jgi:hypothetical protein
MTHPDYDVYLGDPSNLQGYRLKAFTRDQAPSIAAKFSTAAQSETDLDLLKSASILDMSGGMFQIDWSDRQKLARVKGVYNRYDGFLYPMPNLRSPGTSFTGYYPTAKCESESIAFLTIGDFSAGNFHNFLYKLDGSAAPGITNIPLPALAATTVNGNVNTIAFHKGFVFVGIEQSSGVAVSAQRYNIAAGTWQDIGGGVTKFFTLRNLLYGINYQSTISSITNETIAGFATYTAVTTAGRTDSGGYAYDAIEFNGAAYIAKPDGIFRFDGTNAIRVLKHVTKQLHEFNGAIYFLSKNWLYKFDGTNITRLQYFGYPYTFDNTTPTPQMSLSSNTDYLFIICVNPIIGYDIPDTITSPTQCNDTIWAYDGIGFTIISERDSNIGSLYAFGLIATNNRLFRISASNSTGANKTFIFFFDLNNLFKTTDIDSGAALDYTISAFDDGFPNIQKALEKIESLHKGLIAGDQLLISYKFYDGTNWSSWYNAGILSSTSILNSLETTDDTHRLFKRFKINIIMNAIASNSSVALRSCSFRYTLQPRVRWRWQAHIMADGNKKSKDNNNSFITNDSNELTNLITKSIRRKTPSYMLSPDFGYLKSTINNTALSFIIKGQVPTYTDPYNEYPLVALKNDSNVWEIFRVSNVSYNSGADETTITILERGYLNITAAQISANAEFHLCYKVYINRLLRENTILDPNTINQQATSLESQIQREFLLEIVEV